MCMYRATGSPVYLLPPLGPGGTGTVSVSSQLEPHSRQHLRLAQSRKPDSRGMNTLGSSGVLAWLSPEADPEMST